MGTRGTEQDRGTNPALQIVSHRPDIDIDDFKGAKRQLESAKGELGDVKDGCSFTLALTLKLRLTW